MDTNITVSNGADATNINNNNNNSNSNNNNNSRTLCVSPAKALLNTNSNSSALNTANTTTSNSVAASNAGNTTTSKSSSTPAHAHTPAPTHNTLNLRHSLLYDSGAESGDAEEQRLIRTPSLRSHKFIIIPASPNTPGGATAQKKPTLRQTISATSLASLATQMQLQAAATANAATTGGSGMPSRSGTPTLAYYYQQQQQQQPYHQQHHNMKTYSHPSTSSLTDASNHYMHPSHHHQHHHHQHHQHHLNDQATTSSVAVSPPTFTLEDCDENLEIADALSPTNLAQTKLSPFKFPTSATVASFPSHAATASSMQEFGLRPRDERTRSSMRSVASVCVPNTYDVNNSAMASSFPNQLLLPTAYGNELSASSYIYRDHVANQIFSDVTSVRSLASIGIGSTDGRKLVIRRVPHTPNELLNLVNPPTPPPPGVDDDDDDSFMDVSDETAHLKRRQQHWANKMQFVLACIGYSVGLGNVWRFPYMCYKSGGGVFLVPYCIILIVCSIPLLFMELSVGQYTGRGPIGALGQLCPLFKGAGLASVVVSFLMSTYYSVIIGYSIYYFFTSFKPYMPWIDCNNRWNTPDCWVPQRKEANMTAPNTSRTPSEEFFENKVLQISPGIEYPGQMRWELFACLICAWMMVYFATWKSIKSSAKVRYFTATFPFFLIIILLGRAVTLDGADEGLRYFFRPNWEELKNANVWINAASQNFNSLGITFGSMISFASYNKYNNNIVRDTISVSLVNIGTSLLVGVFAFATLGNLALEQNTNVKNVIHDGPGLIFVVYPQAMAKMPYAQLWAVMFFFMLLCLGLNSQFAIVEVVVTSIQDGYPNWIKRHLGYHEIVVLIVCVISFGFGLPNLIQGGIYFFQLMDHYAASVTIMFLAFCQMIAIAWLYGAGRLSKNIKQMTGKAPSLYFKSCWVLFGPCLLFAIWVLSLINYHEPTYHNGAYKYPEWAYGIGWMFASFSLICIPGYVIFYLLHTSGDTLWERVQNALRPNIYECKICGKHHCEHDYPEQEQYMLAQEMAGVYKPASNIKQKPTNGDGGDGGGGGGIHTTGGNKWGYNPMYLQQQKQLHQQQKQHLQQQKQQHLTAENQSLYPQLQPQSESTYEHGHDHMPHQHDETAQKTSASLSSASKG